MLLGAAEPAEPNEPVAAVGVIHKPQGVAGL